MSPSIDLNPQTFARLQKHAIPLIDNIENVINRLVDYYEASKTSSISPLSTTAEDECPRQFASTVPPNLTHTKVLSVDLCGRRLSQDQTNWNSVLIATIREAKERTKHTSDLKQLVTVNFVHGEKNSEGYRYVPDIGISVQQQDANASWRTACFIAQQLNLPLIVTFVWRQKEGAAFPGVRGQLSVPT